MFVGNLTKREASKQARAINSLLSYRKTVQLSEALYKKKITNSLLLSLNPNQHLVSRVVNSNKDDSNNVYLTYFKLGLLKKEQKVFGLSLEKVLSNLVFDELRNKLNLGYVAHAGLKVFYHNLGLIILVQGENFKPHQIEKEVERVLDKLIKNLTNQTDQEILDIVV